MPDTPPSAGPIAGGDSQQTPVLQWRVTGVAVAGTAVAAAVAVVLAVLIPPRLAVTGIPDTEPLVRWLLPVLKAVFDLSAALTVGWLLAAVAFVPPQRSGVLDVGGYRAVRAASVSAWVWCASALALVPVTFADTMARPLVQSLRGDMFLTAVEQIEASRGYLIAAAVAVIVALVARSVLRIGWVCWLLVIALVGLIPRAVSGHASGSADHDIAVDTMLFHLVGMSVWVGGLVAFLGLARQRVDHLPLIARRYSTAALIAFLVVAASGVVNSWVRLTYLSDLWTTDYGRLLVLKGVLLLALGVIGFAHRQRTIPDLESGRTGPLIRLAAVEVIVMAATIGVAAVLARTPPPPLSGRVQTLFEISVESILGFVPDGPPTFWRLLTDWRFNFLLGTAVLVAAGLYLFGVRRLSARGDRWPVGRTAAWLLGCLLVLLATSSGLGKYAQTQFSIHMIAHMVLGMGAPILLVLGGPVTLLLRVLPAAPRDGVPGLREGIVAVMHGRLIRVVTHPLFVVPLFIGSFYAVYFTPVFELMMSSHLGHLVMNVHFLLVGYLYYWVIIGVDPAPRQLPHVLKLGLLIAPIPFHAFFGLALMSSHEAMAAAYYRGLSLPWAPDLVADQRLGGAIAWGVTEVPMLVVMVALVAQWARSEERLNQRADRRKDQLGDPELDAYNAMLEALADQEEGWRATGPTRPPAPESTDPTDPAGPDAEPDSTC